MDKGRLAEARLELAQIRQALAELEPLVVDEHHVRDVGVLWANEEKLGRALSAALVDVGG